MRERTMATIKPATPSTPRHLLTVGLIVLTVLAAFMAWISWGGLAGLPVDLPDVVAPGNATPANVPEVLASPSLATEPATSPPDTRSIALPDATVTQNGDGRVLIQFEGLRPGVTAE